MGHVHNVFHISMLKKYIPDPSHILPYAEIPLRPDVIYEEQPAEILAREIYMLHNKETPWSRCIGRDIVKKKPHES